MDKNNSKSNSSTPNPAAATGFDHTSNHIDEEMLLNHASSTLSPELRQVVNLHVVTCGECAEQLVTARELVAYNRAYQAARAKASSRSEPVGRRRPTFSTRRIVAGLAVAASLIAVIFRGHLLPIKVVSGQPSISQATLTSLGLNAPMTLVLTQSAADLKQMVELPIGKGNDTRQFVEVIQPIDKEVLTTRPSLEWKTVEPGVIVVSAGFYDGDLPITTVDHPKGTVVSVNTPLSPSHIYSWEIDTVRSGVPAIAQGYFYIPKGDVIVAMHSDLSGLTPIQRSAIYIKAGRLDAALKELKSDLPSESDRQTRDAIKRVMAAIKSSEPTASGGVD